VAKGLKLRYLFIFTKKQINTEQDLKGLKIRAGGRLQVEMMKKLGVAPVSMGSPEIYTALQRGVLDGVFYTLGAAFSYKFYEVTDHVTLTNFSQIAVPTSINPKTLTALPKDLQDIIYKEARVSGIRGSMLYNMEDARGVEEFGRKGAKVSTASKELEAEIRKLVEPIRKQYIEDCEKRGLPVREMLKEMEQLRDKYSNLAFGNIMEMQIKDPVQGIW